MVQAQIASPARRAIGIVRVSSTAGRKAAGDRFISPREQQQRIEQWCRMQALELVEVFEELDVSGGKPLARRPGLSSAVDHVERGAADIVVAAYFDRLVRSLAVQAEVLERVEAEAWSPSTSARSARPPRRSGSRPRSTA
jgi:DNA invertase Pin-like site-specific DNA recombinase